MHGVWRESAQMNPFDTVDTPEKAYWAGYMMISSTTDGGVTVVPSNEADHLDSLEGILPHGEVEGFDIVAGDERVKVREYHVFRVEDAELAEFAKNLSTPPGIVRKLASHFIRGMIDARPVWKWLEDSIDFDISPIGSDYILQYMPYLRVEYLSNGRVRLYTCTTYETNKAMSYLYRYAPVAKTSRKRLYGSA